MAQTGSSCPLHVKRAMIDWFGPVIREAYGASESGILSHIESEEWLRKPGSVGRVEAGFDVVVLDDDGKECPAGEDGRLFFVDETGRGISYVNERRKPRLPTLRRACSLWETSATSMKMAISTSPAGPPIWSSRVG